MSIQVKLRRGTTSQHSTFTGSEGEVTVDTDKDVVVVHDGTTVGGHPMVKESSLATVATSGDYNDLINIPAAGSGTVTSVALSAPTGLSVLGSPVTTSGTLALSFATGYSIPTTTKQDEWDTAYSWGNHASAGYLDSGDIGTTVQGYSSVLTATTASFTTADETKLDGIEAGAEVNVNADWNAVIGDAQILNKPTLGTASAANSTDFATAAQGTLADSAVQPAAIANMLETTDIGVTVQGYSSVLANTTASFTTADETKLDGIAAGAEVNVNADWNATSGDAQILNKPTLYSDASVNIHLNTSTASVGEILAWNGTDYDWIAQSSGSVTSVTGTVPIVSSGGTTPTISLASGYGDTKNPYASKTANNFLAAPNGTAGAPTFRAIVAADVPTLNQNTTGTSANVTGIVAVANGGTGQTTRQNAMDALAGAVTSGQYLRGNGTDVVMSAIQAADVPTLNQNTTGTAANVTGTVAIANGGTGQTTTNAAFNALVPSQTGQSGKYLTTNGTDTSWATVSGGDSSIEVKDEGTSLTTAATSLNFTGAGVTATASGNDVTVAITSGGISSADIQEFTTTGTSTWTKPAGAKLVHVLVQGGGGGGGSGHKQLATPANPNQGGMGGGGGGWAELLIPAVLLGSTETITVGAGGTGGASQTISGNGISGVNGATSSFGSFCIARGGILGSGGASVAQGSGATSINTANSPVFFATSQLSGSTFYTAHGGTRSSGSAGGVAGKGGKSAGGGGGGGGISATPTAFNGGAGGLGGAGIRETGTGATGGGGAGGTSGGGGGNGLAALTYDVGGSGGGGGAASTTAKGGDGGTGGYPGGGGGGGGACLSGFNSGAGGDGGDGYIRITTFF